VEPVVVHGDHTMAEQLHGLEIIAQDMKIKWTGKTDPEQPSGGLEFIDLIQVKNRLKLRPAVRATQGFKTTQKVQANVKIKINPAIRISSRIKTTRKI